jgi:hypothetical protein
MPKREAGAADKVTTEAQANRIVAKFLNQRKVFGALGTVARPLSAHRDGDIWLVRMNIGLSMERVLEFTVDAATGEVLKYGPK